MRKGNALVERVMILVAMEAIASFLVPSFTRRQKESHTAQLLACARAISALEEGHHADH